MPGAREEEDDTSVPRLRGRCRGRAHTVLSWSVDSVAREGSEDCCDDDLDYDDGDGTATFPHVVPMGSVRRQGNQCSIDVPAMTRWRKAEPPDDAFHQASNFPAELGCPYLRDPSGPSARRAWTAADGPTCLERFAEEAKAAKWGRRRNSTGGHLGEGGPAREGVLLGAPVARKRSARGRRRSTSVPPNWKATPREGAEEEQDEEAPPDGHVKASSASGSCAEQEPPARAKVGQPARDVAEPTPAVFTPDETVIIFDWDDTLFPTWYLSEVVIPCTDNPEARPEGSSRWDQLLPEESPFAEGLRQHAALVEETLRTARSVARVGIVTLSVRPWVLSSASRYLPDLHLEQLLEELRIPIIYAQERLGAAVRAKADIMLQDGVNLMTIAKRAAMVKLLRKLYGKSSPWKNVISIGDSVVERDAIIDALWSQSDHESVAAPCCKTVKLVEEPTIDNLSAELVLLGMWLQSMAAYGQDFDVVMDEAEEEELLRLHGRFSA